MRFEVLNKNPDTVETGLHIALRYEALKLGLSAPQDTTTAEPVKTIDMSALIYDDKGREKQNLQLEGWRNWQDEQTRSIPLLQPSVRLALISERSHTGGSIPL